MKTLTIDPNPVGIVEHADEMVIIRGRYPLTAIWLLAEAKGDIVTKVRVQLTIEEDLLGMGVGGCGAGCIVPTHLLCKHVERWLERYASGGS